MQMCHEVNLAPGSLTSRSRKTARWRGLLEKVHCRLAIGSGKGFTDEMSCLLRTRLRLAILVLFAGFAVRFAERITAGLDLRSSEPLVVFGEWLRDRRDGWRPPAVLWESQASFDA